MLKPDHIPNILTSKEFATEYKFVELAKQMGKCQVIAGSEVFESPFKVRESKAKK